MVKKLGINDLESFFSCHFSCELKGCVIMIFFITLVASRRQELHGQKQNLLPKLQNQGFTAF